MDVSNLSNVSSTYATNAYATQTKTKTTETTSKKTDAAEHGVIYEKSDAQRSAIIEKMKADALQQTEQLRSLVESMMKEQGVQIGTADDMWRFLAGGNFTVTEAAKAEAQKAISEDGYWGVEQTSERIVEFAKALTGGDTSKIEEMKEAFIKGFKAATAAWGKDLPSISQDTYDAVMEKFDKWAGITEETVEE